MSIIIGSLFGDAYIHPYGKIQFEHSKQAEAYLEWKFNEMEGIRYPRISYVQRQKNGKTYYSCRFWTKQFFRPLREEIYQGGKKLSLWICLNTSMRLL